MKKTLILLGLVLTCALTFSACENDNTYSSYSNQTNSLVTFKITTKAVNTKQPTAEEYKTYYIGDLSFEAPVSWNSINGTSSDEKIISLKKNNSTLAVMLMGECNGSLSDIDKETLLDGIEESYTSGINEIKQTAKYSVDNGSLSGFHYVMSKGNQIYHHYVLISNNERCVIVGYQNNKNSSDYSEADAIVNTISFKNTSYTTTANTDDTEIGKKVITLTDTYLLGVTTKEELSELIKRYNDQAQDIQDEGIRNMIQTIYNAVNDDSTTLEAIKSYRNILALAIGEELIY